MKFSRKASQVFPFVVSDKTNLMCTAHFKTFPLRIVYDFTHCTGIVKAWSWLLSWRRNGNLIEFGKSLCETNTHTLTHSLSLSLTHTHTHTHTHTQTHIHVHAHTHTHTLSPLSLSLSLFPSLSLSLSLTHSHSLTCCHIIWDSHVCNERDSCSHAYTHHIHSISEAIHELWKTQAKNLCYVMLLLSYFSNFIIANSESRSNLFRTQSAVCWTLHSQHLVLDFHWMVVDSLYWADTGS